MERIQNKITELEQLEANNDELIKEIDNRIDNAAKELEAIQSKNSATLSISDRVDLKTKETEAISFLNSLISSSAISLLLEEKSSSLNSESVAIILSSSIPTSSILLINLSCNDTSLLVFILFLFTSNIVMSPFFCSSIHNTFFCNLSISLVL